MEACTIRGVNTNCRTASHLCDPTRTRAETMRTQVHSVPRGGFHKAGEGPAFGGSLVTFCPVRKSPCGAYPGWQACIWKNRTTDYLSPSTEIVQFVSRETPKQHRKCGKHSRRQSSEAGLPAAGTPLLQGRPWQWKRVLSEESTRTVERQAIYVTPPGPGPKPGGRRCIPYRGVDSTRRGKAPPLVGLW